MVFRYLLFCLCILATLADLCHAAPSYGTRMPKKGQFHLGGQTYAVERRELESGHGRMKSLQHFLLITYGVTDWFALDMKGGAGDTHQKPEGGDEISYPAYLAGGYGFRIRIHEAGAARVVFGFQHISVHPYSVFVDTVKHKAVIDDWQLSLLASREFQHLTSYIGARWSRMDYIHWTEDDRDRVRSHLGKSAGIIAGVDVPIHERVWLNFEGQLLDAKALAASLNISF